MKKLFSILLCVSLMLSVFATAVSASDEVLTSVFFASDAQFYPNYTGTDGYGSSTIESCTPVVDTLVGLAKEDGHEIETFVFGGDYTQNQGGLDPYDEKNQEIFGVPTTPGDARTFPWHYGNNPKYTIAEFKETIKSYYNVSDDNMLFAQGNHEPDITDEENYGLAPGGAYEFDEYIVYIINEQDFAGPRPRTENLSTATNIAPDKNGNPSITQITNPEAVVTKTANELKSYLDNMIAKGDDRPVFIASHQPLYSERFKDYNCYAYLVADVLNEAGKKLDIIYFFGHTHQAVDQIGGGLSYVAKGETLKVANNTSVNTSLSNYTLTDADYKLYTLNFAYMNFGHLARYSGTNANILSSTVVDITPTELILTRYRAKNSYANDAEKVLATETITRINPKKETTVIDGNGETKYVSNNEVYDIPEDTIYTNGTIITRSGGKVTMNGLELTGDISFNDEGKISPIPDYYVKIADGTNNTFLYIVNADTYGEHTFSVKNTTSGKTEGVKLEIPSIYSGNVMLRLDIKDVPSDANLGLVMG